MVLHPGEKVLDGLAHLTPVHDGQNDEQEEHPDYDKARPPMPPVTALLVLIFVIHLGCTAHRLGDGPLCVQTLGAHRYVTIFVIVLPIGREGALGTVTFVGPPQAIVFLSILHCYKAS